MVETMNGYLCSLIRRPIKPKQIGRAPILGRPRLFGGKLLDYIQVTQQHVPLIISSCVSAINRLGLHNQVGLKIDQFRQFVWMVLFTRASFEYLVHKLILINLKKPLKKAKIH